MGSATGNHRRDRIGRVRRRFYPLPTAEVRHFRRNGRIDVPGVGTVEAPILAEAAGGPLIIGVHGPLTPDHAADPVLRDVKEYSTEVPVLLVDEIVIARNLPFASRQVVNTVQ